MRAHVRAQATIAGAGAGALRDDDAAEPGIPGATSPGGRHPLYARALAIWPGLDRTQLTRTHGDPRKIARLVARRTIHSEEAILTLLRSG